LPLRGHGRLYAGAFDPGGRWLATVGRDGAARLWPLAHLDLGRVVLQGHEREVETLAFDGSGRWLATAGNDGIVRLWDLRIESALALACQIAGRNLSDEEWDQYLGDFAYRETCPEARTEGPPNRHQGG
jgi:hypothetical protein